jgi:hypothetical protein
LINKSEQLPASPLRRSIAYYDTENDRVQTTLNSARKVMPTCPK